MKLHHILILITLSAFISTALLYFGPFEGGQQRRISNKNILVVLWNTDSGSSAWASLYGDVQHTSAHEITSYHCPASFNCSFTSNRAYMRHADVVLFDPTSMHPDSWRRVPISMPHKMPYHKWALMHYETEMRFPVLNNSDYRALMDVDINYRMDADVQISRFCDVWTRDGKLSGVEARLSRKPAQKTVGNMVAFISDDCFYAGAAARSAYVKELMNYVNVDAYGTCLRNAEYPKEKMSDLEILELLSTYKYVLAFENANATDYVTETVFQALMAGSLPIYMGAPNVDDWLPSPKSVIKTSDFKSPQDLGYYLKGLDTDDELYDEYFQWKKDRLPAHFQRRVEGCSKQVACRLCEYVAANRRAEKVVQRTGLMSLHFNGHGDYVDLGDEEALHLHDKYTIALWVKPESFGDQRLVDRNRAGGVTGYLFDIQASEQPGRGFIRLCASEGCTLTKHALSLNTWAHVAVVFSSENPSLFDNYLKFYINGKLDSTHPVFEPTKRDKGLPIRFGKPASVHGPEGTFHGEMDNVYIFDRDLEREEIVKLMFDLPSGSEEGLLGFWGFDEPDEDTVYDSGPNQFDGRLFGGTRSKSIEKPLILNKCL